MRKETFQPKDTGKLTNFHYGSKEDKRTEELLTSIDQRPLSGTLDKE
jgi:hypothetical protein